MERSEKLVNIFNGEFPEYPITVADLKKPQSLIGALLQVFTRLGLDTDNILSPPPEAERDAHIQYYWDLLPVINVTRVMNYFLPVLQQTGRIAYPVTIGHFLQPDVATSHSLLLLVINLSAFLDNRYNELAPFEQELFGKRDQVKALEGRKIRLLEMLNEQAEEKGKRAERLEKIDNDIKQLEEELRLEKEAHNEEKKDMDAILEENKQLEKLYEQKKSQKDAILAEVVRKRALRVYDADDIKAQAEQAMQNVKEAEVKLESLKEILLQKEKCLNNLQKIKPNLDQANKLLHEIMKHSEELKEIETGDLDTDSNDGQLEVMKVEMMELQNQLAELNTAQEEFNGRSLENQAKRQTQKTELISKLKETEEKERTHQAHAEESLKIIDDIKAKTMQYAEDKKKAFEQLEQIKLNYTNELKSFEDMLISKLKKTEERIEHCPQKKNN